MGKRSEKKLEVSCWLEQGLEYGLSPQQAAFAPKMILDVILALSIVFSLLTTHT